MNEKVITIEVPKVGDLITKRPEGMGFKEYKEKQREQEKYLHGYNVSGKHIMGRLEGIFIPAYKYKNRRNPYIFIR